ncbi:anti-sigma factor [Yersinia pekkanenii]|uniref:Anti-sigmaE protein n=1 Tax=Yersinia pekkanenii TaxID=1288385 RepID=A0A0T9QY41_9GAMM|nr:anti-sigma factor [Yersinia pekkanenii]CNI34692.1 putative anti-sigmaE protein [Yersinia pekkanenii]CRY68286.1 putative anti-sigmaE protein [Yersinia pekkanenii]
MKNRREYDSALAAEYALGTLRGLAQMRFKRRIRRDPRLAVDVARWQSLFTQLDNQLTPLEPPERVWKRLELQLPPLNVRHIKPNRWSYLGWAVAAGLAALLVIPRLLVEPPLAVPVAVLSNSQQNGQWVVSLEKSTRNLTLTPLNPIAVSNNNSLELWSIPAGEKPHSLGLLNTHGPTHLILAENQLSGNSLLAISLEPHGGSPTGQPTGAVLFSGPLQNL